MSYDITEKIITRRNLAEADYARIDFLALLKQKKINVSPWEEQFITDLVEHPRSLTPGQRDKADELRKQYGHLL